MKAESTRQRSRARNPARAASQRAAKKLGAAGSRTITLEAVYDVDWINEFPLESAVVWIKETSDDGREISQNQS